MRTHTPSRLVLASIRESFAASTPRNSHTTLRRLRTMQTNSCDSPHSESIRTRDDTSDLQTTPYKRWIGSKSAHSLFRRFATNLRPMVPSATKTSDHTQRRLPTSFHFDHGEPTTTCTPWRDKNPRENEICPPFITSFIWFSKCIYSTMSSGGLDIVNKTKYITMPRRGQYH